MQTILRTSGIYFLILVFPSLLFFWGCTEERKMSSLEQQAHLLLQTMADSAVETDKAFRRVSGLKRLNTAGRLGNAVETVCRAQAVLERANQDVGQYTAFIRNNLDRLKLEKLDHYIQIKGTLNRHQEKKRKAMAAYYNAMKIWLAFSQKNFEHLEAGTRQSLRKSYDSLLIRVTQDLDTCQRASEIYKRQSRLYLQKYPAIRKNLTREYKTLETGMGWS